MIRRPHMKIKITYSDYKKAIKAIANRRVAEEKRKSQKGKTPHDR